MALHPSGSPKRRTTTSTLGTKKASDDKDPSSGKVLRKVRRKSKGSTISGPVPIHAGRQSLKDIHDDKAPSKGILIKARRKGKGTGTSGPVPIADKRRR